MNVDGIGSMAASCFRWKAPDLREGDGEAPGGPHEVQVVRGQATLSGVQRGEALIDGADEAGEPDGDAAKGVVRLLLEGHFRGVADVRLRINFYDQLAAAAAEALKPVVLDKAEALAATADAHLGELLSSELLSQEQATAVGGFREAFEAELGALADEYSSTADAGAYSDSLRASFERLMSTLSDLLVPDEAVGSAGQTQPVDLSGLEGPSAAEEPTQDLQSEAAMPPESGDDAGDIQTIADLLDSLRQALAAALEDLSASSSQAPMLAPVSAPHGNGVAYAKFLAIYNEMRGVSEDLALEGDQPEPGGSAVPDVPGEQPPTEAAEGSIDLAA